MAVGRKNFIFFHCPLDGVRFKKSYRGVFYMGLNELESLIPIDPFIKSEFVCTMFKI